MTTIIVCIVGVVVVLPLTLYLTGIIDYAKKAVSAEGKYLMVYFVGNEPEQERIHLAVSEDGYNFKPLNNNEAIITQEKGTKCVRDPHIIRGQDGWFYMVATDMQSNLGWTSNHSLVTWRSQNLVDWQDESIIDLKEYIPATNRAWAPQTIWDEEKDMYMVYFSSSQWIDESQGTSTVTSLYYAYTKDFKTFETTPVEFFRSKSNADTIDGDIYEHNGTYYLYYKDQGKGTICYSYSDKLTGPYTEPEDNIVNVGYKGVEGNFMYNITGTDQYVMLMDSYKNGCFYFQQTSNMVDFKRVNPNDYDVDFSPRHGAVLAITDSEYEYLVEQLGW